MTYVLPVGNTISVGVERFRCPEVLSQRFSRNRCTDTLPFRDRAQKKHVLSLWNLQIVVCRLF